ncbi:hypothetical protein [Bacillus dakarensis]|uniref:hypothetical protein n=1 Tax=Robertmurraya dakarensis TaxID=1926278 RepID=UPI00098104D0|nr:hypothetical protein [Bacillus dakarensis]
MPKYRCVKHQKIMNEKIEDNKIQPYCTECRIEDLLQEQEKQYLHNEIHYIREHKKSVVKEKFFWAFKPSFISLFVTVAPSLLLGALTEEIFSSNNIDDGVAIMLPVESL